MRVDKTSLLNTISFLERRLSADQDNPQLLFDISIRYHALDDYSKANLYYSKLVSKYPLFLKGLLAYGIFLLRWMKNDLATKYFEEYVFNYLTSTPPKEYLPSLTDKFLMGVFDESLNSYRSQIELALSSGALLAPLGLARALIGETEKAKDIFTEALRITPSNAFILYLKGLAEVMSSDYRSAIDSLRESLKLNDHNEKAHFILGFIYLKQKALALAVRHLQKAVEIAPKFYYALLTLGRTYYLQGNFEKAIDVLTKAVKASSLNWQAYYYLGLCYKEFYDYQKAKEAFREALKSNPNSYEVISELAEILTFEGNWKESIEILNKLIKLRPLEWEPYYKLSIAYERIGRYKEAKEMALKAFQLKSDNFQLAFNLGLLSFKTGDEETALKAFRKAADLNPKDLHSRYYLGLINLKRRDYEEAVRYLEEALKVNPHKSETRYYLGMLYAMANKIDKAVKLFEEALQTKNDDPLLLFNLGAAYAREGKIAEAEQQLERAIDSFKLTSEKDLEIFSTLALQVKVNIEAAELRRKLYRAYLQTVISLAKLIDAKDKYTQGHTFRVAKVSYRIGVRMRLPEEVLEGLHIGAWLHDIGKIGIPDRILNKPGRLTDEEYEVMKSHVTIGAKALENVEFPWPHVIDCIKYHHERWDGSGYPEGLKGEEIPLPARIIAVADVFDALVTKRPYKPPLPPYKAIEIIQNSKGKHFDPQVVDAFLEIVDDIIFEYYAGFTEDEDYSSYIENFQDFDIIF